MITLTPENDHALMFKTNANLTGNDQKQVGLSGKLNSDHTLKCCSLGSTQTVKTLREELPAWIMHQLYVDGALKIGQPSPNS